jgi:hypothetical protein
MWREKYFFWGAGILQMKWKFSFLQLQKNRQITVLKANQWKTVTCKKKTSK